MKRIIPILTLILAFALLLAPVTTYALSHTPGDTDISVTLDESRWYVFTRENLENNPELDELGISYNDVHRVLYDNKGYVDALLLYEDRDFVEFLVRKNTGESDDPAQLSKYDDDEVLEFAEELAKHKNTEDYEVYKTKYKFAKLEYYDAEYKYYICEYYTIVNREFYTLTFQSPTQFTDEEKQEMERILEDVRFNVDLSLKEPETADPSEDLVTRVITGAAVGAIVGAVGAAIGKKKKKNKENAAATPTTEAE